MTQSRHDVPATPQAPPASNGAAIAALVLGILALVFALLPFTFFLGVICGLAAAVLAAAGLRRASRPGVPGRGMAAAGLVTGLLGVVLGVLWVVGIAALVNNADIQQLLDRLGDRLSQLPELRP
ncbi:MAG: DUF4190 domain-containing protein [Actinobacteria bacterium]|nr:DUF4190 domain-containing protein [Actinomycetota bacterium]